MVEEVVVPVAILGEKRMSVVVCCCHLEHGVQVWVERFGSACWGNEGEEGSEEDDGCIHRVATRRKKLELEGVRIDLPVLMMDLVML